MSHDFFKPEITKFFSPQFPPKLFALFYPGGMKEHQGQKTQQLQYSDDSENVKYTHTIYL